MTKIIFVLFFFTFITSCHEKASTTKQVIIIQPFAAFDSSLSQNIFSKLKAVDTDIILKSTIELPQRSYYPLRKRYRADTLLRFLDHYGFDTVVIGLTNKDISTSKGNIIDWGVMGLGYCPGNACVVSTFRLSGTSFYDQFYKVAIHELGHTQGLPHCANKTCFMRDAEGGNPLNQEKDFCNFCKSFLANKGWQFRR